MNFTSNTSQRKRGLRAAAVLLGALAASANGVELATNFNPYTVFNKPSNITFFNVTGNGWMVNQLQTYHWNNGLGTPFAGSIHLYDASLRLIGSYQSVGIAGQGGARNANWVANVALRLGPGRYAVTDDSISTWSYNAQSGNAGFLKVNGTVSTQPLPPVGGQTIPVSQPSTPPPAPVPFGGNCRGAGCTHPDLRPYGGDGPAGTVPSVSVHRPVPRTVRFIEQLSPSTSWAAEAAKCANQFHGNLVLKDDEPYYYYFSGLYAVVMCVQ